MTPPPLRPGGRPAQLLLRLWSEQAKGQRVVRVSRCRERDRLAAVGYVEVVGDCLTLTQSGRAAARTLEAGS